VKFSLALCAAAVLVAGCGQGAVSAPVVENEEAISEPTAPAVETVEPAACVLFADDGPDSRFVGDDEPRLTEAFTQSGITLRLLNAKGDLAKFTEMANELIGGDCFVLFMTSPDSATGVAVIAKAQERGVPVVDYENLTLGGGADYHLGFDLVSVGLEQGVALLECLPEKIKRPRVVYLNGSPTDVNATLLKLGYAEILEGTEGKKARISIIDDQSVPDWAENEVADIVKLVWARRDNQVDGLIAASDGIAIAALDSLPNDAKPPVVVAQGATLGGLQAVIDARLCATVFKPVSELALGAVEIATQIQNTGVFETDDSLIDIATNVPVPALLVPARVVKAEQVAQVAGETGISITRLCGEERKEACQALGLA
jgi:D-xylose transport system substrate-binding protein